jgi:hypothetical protein
MSLFRKLVGIFQAAGVALRKRLLSGGPPVYVEDVFSTNLYTTTGSDQTITNNIDLSTYGGLVWVKGRSAVKDNVFVDTVRGVSKSLVSNTQNAEDFSSGNYVKAFSTTGFTVSGIGAVGSSGTFGTWTFRKQPKFFDIVTYTGTGSARTVSHDLGSTPGFIIVKSRNNTYIRSLGATKQTYLDATDTTYTGSSWWNNTTPTDSVFTVGTSTDTNNSGTTYIAYLFAHDAGGFGLTGTDNNITCGSFTTDASGNCNVTLGWEPQWMLYKPSNNATNWQLVDNMRGITADNGANVLAPNSDATEQNLFGYNGVFNVNSTGFTGTSNGFYASKTYIYIAIRRPMKVPTVGTSVYSAVAYTGDGSARTISTTITPDLSLTKGLSTNYVPFWNTRLQYNKVLDSSAVINERAPTEYTWGSFFINPNAQAGIIMASGSGGGVQNSNADGTTYINWNLKRAPGFMDIVCYTGAGVNTITHNLGVVPELMIVKKRSTTVSNTPWVVYSAALGNGKNLALNTTAAAADDALWDYTNPTSTVFSVRNSLLEVNYSGATYIAYLFATCPGVSKVGSFSYATGSSTDVDCGFTNGARFVLLKQSNGIDDWYVWDTTRGINAGNDPFVRLNSNAVENSSYDGIDPYSPGFTIPAGALGTGTFIFLAIA